VSTRPPKRRDRADKAWFRAAYVGTAVFFALEALHRAPGAAASMHASDDDRGTTRTIGLGYAISSGAPLLLRWLPGPQMPPSAGPAGVIAQAAGLGLRTWSMRTLGRSYTRTLRTRTDQPVVTAGPYRYVRHPGYSGSLLTWIGYALASRSLPAVAVVAGVLGRAYRRRIDAEEKLLIRELPGYAAYRSRTKSLVPFVW
jgi:protein-S-isoprenylcysteine O-methyltransferase